MASGVLGNTKPSGGTPDLATAAIVTATSTTTLVLSICNQTTAADTVKIAILPNGAAASGAIPVQNYIEFDYSLAANSTYERTGIVLEVGARIICGSGAGSVSFVAYGLES